MCQVCIDCYNLVVAWITTTGWKSHINCFGFLCMKNLPCIRTSYNVVLHNYHHCCDDPPIQGYKTPPPCSNYHHILWVQKQTGKQVDGRNASGCLDRIVDSQSGGTVNWWDRQLHWVSLISLPAIHGYTTHQCSDEMDNHQRYAQLYHKKGTWCSYGIKFICFQLSTLRKAVEDSR